MPPLMNLRRFDLCSKLNLIMFFSFQTEDMLKTAENLLGPYEWGVYDVLVLPPSFPFGGMENPYEIQLDLLLIPKILN